MVISEATDATVSAKLFRGLGDPTRLAILMQLAHVGEQRVVDLVSFTGTSQANVSKHLACLAGCGLVVGRPSGRETYYRVEHPELIQLLRAAEELLGVTGHDVELCRNHAPIGSK
jgi:ArsR family transcriptional regulator, cadmium/lead-responsive transcriptional repressor